MKKSFLTRVLAFASAIVLSVTPAQGAFAAGADPYTDASGDSVEVTDAVSEDAEDGIEAENVMASGEYKKINDTEVIAVNDKEKHSRSIQCAVKGTVKSISNNSAATVTNYINDIRKQNEGDKYTKIEWSGELQMAALRRSAERAVRDAQTRPSGATWDTAISNECNGFNNKKEIRISVESDDPIQTALKVIVEKKDGDYNDEYKALYKGSTYTYIGISAFSTEGNNKYIVVITLGGGLTNGSNKPNKGYLNHNGSRYVGLFVKADSDHVSNYVVTPKQLIFKTGDKPKQLFIQANLKKSSNGNNTVPGIIYKYDNITWKVQNAKVASFDEPATPGKIFPKASGSTAVKATITIPITDGYTTVTALGMVNVRAGQVDISKKGAISINKIPDQIYTGEKLMPEIEVSIGGTKLVEGDDYSVTYANNKNASTPGKPAKITIKALSNNLKGTLSFAKSHDKALTFQIKKMDITDASKNAIDGSINLVVADTVVKTSGKKLKPSVQLYLNGTKIARSNYDILYYAYGADPSTATKTPRKWNGTDASGNILIRAKGTSKCITGSRSATFRIVGHALTNDEKATKFTVDFKNPDDALGIVYTGKFIEPKVIVNDRNGSYLTEGKDYTLSYFKNLKKGTGTILIKGIGNYSGIKKKTFKIIACGSKNNDPEPAGVVAKVATNATFTGYRVNAPVEVTYNGMKLRNKKDYTLTYKFNKAVSDDYEKAEVTIKGKGNYGFLIVKRFDITPHDLSYDAEILIETVPKYNGVSNVEPKPIVYVNGVKLELDVDYTLEYGNNKIADDKTQGIGTVKVIGKGNYKGSRTEQFPMYK